MPNKVGIAFSGGVDSVVMADFISRKRNIDLLHFNQGPTDPNSMSETEVADWTKRMGADGYKYGECDRERQKGESMEEFWRNCRYEWLHSLDYEYIAVAHHIDDVLETWIWGSVHGMPKLIPYKRNHNVYRPFLLTTKNQIWEWQRKNSLAYKVDTSNEDLSKQRNYIRKNLVSHVEKLNIGVRNILKKKVISENSGNLYIKKCEI